MISALPAYEYFVIAAIVTFMFLPLLYLVRRWERRRDRRFGGASIDGRWELEQAMLKLQAQFDEFRRESERKVGQYELKIKTLEGQINMLFERWQQTLKQLAVVERENQGLQVQVSELQRTSSKVVLPPTPLLHIVGDTELGRQDRVRLNRARVPYRTLENATQKMIEEEFQRRREDGTEYLWVLVSAHGTREGTLLEDGIAPPWWWSSVIGPEIRLVIFASCDGPEVGDAVAGIARRVIVMYGDIPSDNASAFILALFRAKMQGLDADIAFPEACRQVPQIRPFVDMRKS